MFDAPMHLGGEDVRTAVGTAHSTGEFGRFVTRERRCIHLGRPFVKTINVIFVRTELYPIPGLPYICACGAKALAPRPTVRCLPCERLPRAASATWDLASTSSAAPSGAGEIGCTRGAPELPGCTSSSRVTRTCHATQRFMHR